MSTTEKTELTVFEPLAFLSEIESKDKNLKNSR